MGIEGELRPDAPSPDPDDVFNAVDVHKRVMHAVAKYADIQPGQLRGVLFRLADQPDEVWPKDSDEQLAQRFITLAGLPDMFTLIDDWAAPLGYAFSEIDALLDGVPPAVILTTLALPEREEREEVLIQAWDEGWDVQQTKMAVRAAWNTLEVPAKLLAAVDQFTAALEDPALVYGSPRYATLRRALFESEQRCVEFVEEQHRKSWQERELEGDV